MSRLIIKTGTLPNDKTGDSLFAAFNKVNANFEDVYATLASNTSGIDFGNIAASIIPTTDITYDLGSSTKRFRHLYVGSGSITLGNTTLTITNGKLSSSTGFDLGGSVAPVATLAGSLVNGNHSLTLGTDALVSFPSFENSSAFIQGSEIGSANSSIAVSAKDRIILTTNILQSAKQWNFNKDGSLSVPIPEFINFEMPLTSQHFVPRDGKSSLTLSGSPWVFHGAFGANETGSIELLADSIFPTPNNPGYVTGDEFIFDELTHHFYGYTLHLILTDVMNPGGTHWTANLQFSQPPVYPSTLSSTGAIKLVANSSPFVFGTNGDLKLSGALHVTTGVDGAIIGTNGVVIKATHANPLGLEWSLNGEPNIYSNDPALNTNTASLQFGLNGVNIEVNNPTSGSSWTFGPDGKLRLPAGGDILNSSGTSILASTGNIEFRNDSINDFNGITITNASLSSSATASITVPTNGLGNISILNGSYIWNFDINGYIQYPNNARQQDSSSTTCGANNYTVIYTGTDQYIHTIKLIVQVEGHEGNDGQWHTQSCEILVAKSFNNNSVAATVYAVVHTSIDPLAIFTANWNSTSNRVEVKCQPTSTTTNVTVRTFATEILTAD